MQGSECAKFLTERIQNLKIAVIGANPANVEEIRTVVVESLGGIIEIETATVDRYRQLSGAYFSLYALCLLFVQSLDRFVFVFLV